jgi:chromosome segregation protein
MQFTKLRLTGFKSFVDSTELWIEPGLTGIVGPNGCGKSNLVEALRWVMGESSAKQMRGGEMDDMIFGGTDNRPPRNLAEVLLTMDNSDRSAPAQFNDVAALDVVRRIERGSGSTYRVNGREVRARDVQTLFADASSGARSTALVSQGRIGAIISAKPTDRRHLLEEAAGITGLHSRRHEAELRLRAAETNLERLDDVLVALEEQLRGLKRQARQATRYRNISDHIRRTEAIALHWQWAEATAERGAAAKTLAEAETQVGEMTRLAAAAAAAQADAGEEIPALRHGEAEQAAALQRLLLARDALELEEQRLETAQRQLADRIGQIAGDMERETALRADADDAIARLDEEQARIRDIQGREEDDMAAARERLAAAAALVGRLDGDFTRLTEQVAADEAREAALNRRIAELELQKARLVQRLDEGMRERAEAERRLASEGALDDAGGRVELAREALDAARAAHEESERAHADADAAETEARAAYQQTESSFARLRAEEEALTALLTVGDPDLWPPMIDAVVVKPGFEVALAAALGDDLSAPSDEAAPIHWRALPVFADPPPLPAGVQALSTVVEAPAALARRLSQIGVVKNPADAPALCEKLVQGQRLVSRTGDLWRWDGYTAVGDAAEAAARRLAQHNRLKELHERRTAADATLAEVTELYEQVRDASRHATGVERSAREAVREADAQFQDARDRKAELDRTMAQARSRLEAFQQTAETLRADQAETGLQTQAARDELAALVDVEERREAAAKVRTELSEARILAGETQSVHDRMISETAARRQRREDLAGELDSWRRRAANANRQREQLEARRVAAAADLERLDARPAEIATQRSALFEQIGTAEHSRDAAADALAEAETRLAACTRELREKEAALGAVREERVRCQALVEQMDQMLAGIDERVRERLDCTPEDALASVGVANDDKLPQRDAVEIRLERLKRERDNMGPVNLRADVEAQELDERIQTMQAERDDLIAAIARLRQGIAGLNREGRARLLAAFKEVDAHFGALFIRLFGGGRAHMALTDADDPLEAGLEIMASPPGKRLQTLSLLSGGEQALTGLALLFAVFMTNPAPICVLDEVDAPLDDANVERFCQLLSEIAERSATRFLLVTHHRLTMARMDRLFGVTMAEQGVSQLVSVDLHTADGLREAG